MLIGLDISRLATAQRTGTEHYTGALLQALAATDHHNHYRLYCNQLPAALPPLPPNFALRPIPLERVWTHVRLSLEMAHAPPDVLFVPAHALPLVLPRRSVVTIHDLGFVHHPQAHTLAQRLYHRVFTPLSVHRATHIVVISHATKRDLEQIYGVPSHKITVVYHGVDKRFQPLPPAVVAPVRARYGLGDPYLLFVSTVQPRKNIERLLEAFGRARRMLSPAPLTLAVAGKRGWLAEQIHRRVDELELHGVVRFLDYVPDDDLPALLNGALAYVVPSLHEGFGMTVLEAQACGTPVLASNTSSLPEVVGPAGLLVDPFDVAQIANSIVRLHQDAALRATLRVRGRQHAAAWTWERTAQQTLAVLEAAAQGH